MTHTERARVLLELVEDCLRNGQRETAVEAIAKVLAAESPEGVRKRQRLADSLCVHALDVVECPHCSITML